MTKLNQKSLPEQEAEGAHFERAGKWDANKLSVADRPVHDWYRFVLSFPPHLVRTYIDRFELNGNHLVLDPFCGTGTTIVECKKLGIPSVGFEANPMALFASQVKTTWKLDPGGLVEHARQVAVRVKRKLHSTGFLEPGAPLFASNDLDHEERSKLLKLPPETNKLLLGNSISPIPLHKTLLLFGYLSKDSSSPYHRHELLALAKALVTTIGNLHFGPEVGVGPPKMDAPVINSWFANVAKMADDLVALQGNRETAAKAFFSDSRKETKSLRGRYVDAVITSPPYPNEKDYTRTTRLESVILGLIRTKQDLRAFKTALLRSNTRNVYKGDQDDEWISSHREIQGIADEIEARRIALGKTSGFERLYAKVTKLYFGGMARHLTVIRKYLRPGAKLAYVVGDQASYLRVLIRTGRILADLAETLGYEVVGLDLFRTRLATATREQLREEVLVLRWPG